MNFEAKFDIVTAIQSHHYFDKFPIAKKYPNITIIGLDIVESYELEVVGNEIYITEQVNNILFYKR